jgi:hypothetical protein
LPARIVSLPLCRSMFDLQKEVTFPH